MDSNLVRELEEFARKALNVGNRGAHTFEHTLRVRQLCFFIGRQEDADLEVLEAAALLHDIGRPEEAVTGKSHAEIGADMAVAFLAMTAFPAEKLSKVASAIQTHRFSENITPESLEGQILSDADKLDAMGAVGLARTIAESLMQKRGLFGTIQHIDRKLLKLGDQMLTKSGSELAGSRHMLLEQFMIQLAREFEILEEPLPPELKPFSLKTKQP